MEVFVRGHMPRRLELNITANRHDEYLHVAQTRLAYTGN